MNEKANETIDQVEDQPTQTIQDQFFGIKNDVVTDAPEVELEGATMKWKLQKKRLLNNNNKNRSL